MTPSSQELESLGISGRFNMNFGGFCANRSRGSISHSNLRPIFIDFEDSRDMFFLRPPVVSAGGRSGGLKRRSSGETGSDALASSYARLRTAIWGGALLPPTEAQTMLERIGYVAVQMLPAPPSATVAIVAGRRRSLTTRGTTTKQCGFHSAY